MKRLAFRQRMAVVALTVLTLGSAGTALAAPENGGNPNVTLEVSPNDGDKLSGGSSPP
ncbi:MAG: hypothetical protein H0T70_00955 [Acidimicrobiia bacterium]|nr:hypothetical protein [Acidimicrobiia bacterium]